MTRRQEVRKLVMMYEGAGRCVLSLSDLDEHDVDDAALFSWDDMQREIEYLQFQLVSMILIIVRNDTRAMHPRDVLKLKFNRWRSFLRTFLSFLVFCLFVGLFVCCPDMAFAVDWALKNNDLSCLLLSFVHIFRFLLFCLFV